MISIVACLPYMVTLNLPSPYLFALPRPLHFVTMERHNTKVISQFCKEKSHKVQGIKSRSPLKILKKKIDFAWNPEPKRHCLQKVFMKFNSLFLILTFQIIYQSPNYMTQPFKSLNLLTINLKDESFHNSIE